MESGLIIAIPIIIGLVFLIVTMWHLFEKAGQEGWKCIIPIYNAVVLCQIGRVSPWILLLALTAIIPIVGTIAGIVMQFTICRGVSEMFNKGIGFTFGLFFLPFIFYPILAFGKSTYDDPDDFDFE